MKLSKTTWHLKTYIFEYYNENLQILNNHKINNKTTHFIFKQTQKY